MPNVLNFRPGQFIFRENESSKAMYLINKGSVAIRKGKNGGYIEIAQVYSGEVIGELSFFDRKPRSASAVALTDVEALEITFDSLDKIYGEVPPYLKTIISCVAERLRRADDTIRRLQRDVVGDVPTGASQSDEFTATDALLAVRALDENSDEDSEDSELEPESGKKKSK
jgi:CRP-like cAMP-binding protein